MFLQKKLYKMNNFAYVVEHTFLFRKLDNISLLAIFAFISKEFCGFCL